MLKDPQRAPVVGARVELQRQDTLALASTETNERGQYVFKDIPAGPYAVTVFLANSASLQKITSLPEGAKFRANFKTPNTSGRRLKGSDLLPSDVLVNVHRTGCLGPCPSFSMTVFEDGRWTWEFADHVRVTDDRSGQLSARQLEDVREAKRELLAAPDYHWFHLTDVPALFVMVRDTDKVIELVSRKSNKQTAAPPQVQSALKTLNRVLPIRRFVGRSWR